MRFLLHVFICLTIFSISSCGTLGSSGTAATNTSPEPKIKIPSMVEGCTAVAKVINYTHESDCQYLLKLEDGTILFPGEMPKVDVPFYEGAGLKIGYELFEPKSNDVVKISCTKHDYVAKITCMEEHVIREKGLPETHDDCKPIKNPYKFTWMRDAITELQPTRVNEYPYSIGYLYEFKNSEGSSLYDCLGNKMCTTSEGPDCQSIIETLEKPKVILVMNN